MDEKDKEQTTSEEKVDETVETGGTPDEANGSVKEEDSSSEEKGNEEADTDSDKADETPDENSDKEEPDNDETEDKEADEEITADKAKEATVDKATNVLKDKGFDYAELQKEFNEKGEISKETKEKLAEVGITEEIVDNYVEGQKARVERELDELAVCVGGRAIMNQVIQWAAANISDEEKASINKITDANVMKVYLKDLKNRMEEKEGKVPETQLNGEGGKPAVEMFESQAQMFEAIKDPRYKKDEVYRAKVMKKIQASREAGIDLGI